jgi:uncharacterized protein YbaA (DUF1428 family)
MSHYVDGFVVPVPMAKLAAYRIYRSRQHRDTVNANVMRDPCLPMDPASMPFDGKRIFRGGFKSIVKL